MSDIPLTNVHSSPCLLDSPSAKKYSDFLNDCLYLHLVIEHDVVIIDKKNSRRKSIDNGRRPIVKLMRRVISLLDVALAFVFALSGYGSALQPVNILNIHPQSIVASYLLAVGIRDFLVHQSMVTVEDAEGIIDVQHSGDERKSRACSEVWNYLTPNAQTRERFLKRVLQVSEEDYRKVHVTDEDEDSIDEEESEQFNAAADNGVCDSNDRSHQDISAIVDLEDDEEDNTTIHKSDDEEEEGRDDLYGHHFDDDQECGMAAASIESEGGSSTISRPVGGSADDGIE